MSNQIRGDRRLTIRSIIGFVVLILYSVSKYYFFLGLGLLIILAIVGEIKIQNAGILALGMLLFFPLRYLNKLLNEKNETESKHDVKF